ncbi:amidohydrolase family protein [Paraeggerthella hongkongensis]|uniref:amidohydrolase family protein n=1 Tax=Paraeggerthella hominis TaxID=2897351 RepID=UPI001C102347|nr:MULTISPECIES: amidohydrolase family protein [Paraeggerthella]MBU5406402.1 amidohydrolase family protein [Paraeggerthella hongkongensis]MCD2432723.1 amidohydrolase family protein [Paraeggerthella hominis]
MAVIDAHAHIYPDKIASRAVDAIGDFYVIDMYGKGTVEHLLASKERAPITHFIVHSVATTPGSVETINNFIAEQCRLHPEFIGFMTMHQDYPDPEKEIERAIGLGLHGMKLHPDTQHVNMDDPRLMNVYEIIEGRMPIVLHTGDYRYDYSHPQRLLNVLKTFPDLVVDAAHFGCWSRYDVGYDILHNENLFVDASSSQFFLGQRRTVELARMWGTDRIMFGSDFPMWDPAAEYDQFVTAGFSEDELENMLWHNAERFAGVKVG